MYDSLVNGRFISLIPEVSVQDQCQASGCLGKTLGTHCVEFETENILDLLGFPAVRRKSLTFGRLAASSVYVVGVFAGFALLILFILIKTFHLC